MKVKIQGSTLIIELPMQKAPPPSKSGKSRIVAGTGGFADTGVLVSGKPLRVAVNATIAP